MLVHSNRREDRVYGYKYKSWVEVVDAFLSVSIFSMNWITFHQLKVSMSEEVLGVWEEERRYEINQGSEC